MRAQPDPRNPVELLVGTLHMCLGYIRPGMLMPDPAGKEAAIVADHIADALVRLGEPDPRDL